jgi:hypothetical protein
MTDYDLSRIVPEVFAPPPEIVAGLMAEEAEAAIREWSPIAARILERRALFTAPRSAEVLNRREDGVGARMMAALRRYFFDHFGRR